jgi:hypothetical protein
MRSGEVKKGQGGCTQPGPPPAPLLSHAGLLIPPIPTNHGKLAAGQLPRPVSSASNGAATAGNAGACTRIDRRWHAHMLLA